MLKLLMGGDEHFDEEKQEFLTVGGFELELEHSLVSLSKWESKTGKPFLSKSDKSNEEIRLYVEAMIISDNVPPDFLIYLTQEHIDQINAYIESSESATTFGSMPEHKGRGEVITSELIYYWMVAFNIPFECERWHLNRLFALIRICNIKNSKPKKMSKSELIARNRRLNEERKQQFNTRG
jgi:hypothetical protein